MKLNDDIITAINSACKKAGSQCAFADLVGTKRQNLSRYLNGKVKDITPKIMARLWPHIREFAPYIPEECREVRPSESLEMTALLREKISVLEERLKLAAETTASKNTIIHDKNRRINELEVELAKMRKS